MGCVAQLTTFHRSFSARSGLVHVGGFFAGGLALSALYATTGFGVLCPFRAVTGWDCPLCGGTRMGSALLHGEIGAAFAFNPLALLLIAGLGLLGLLWGIEVLGGPAVRPPAGLRRRLTPISSSHWLIVGSVVAAVYTVVRNLS